MSDVKGRLKDILNTTLGGQNRQQTSLDMSRGQFGSARSNSKSMDMSLDNFKKSKNSRQNQYNSSSSLNKSLRFTQTSTQSSFQTSFSKNNCHKRTDSSKLSTNMDLIFPSTDATLFFSRYSTQKIKTKIDNIHQILTKDGVPQNNFRNRPVLNLNRPEFGFNSREYFAQSPTATRKKLLTTSNIFRNYNTKKQISNVFSNFNFRNGKTDENDVETFTRELIGGGTKSSMFERYTSPKKKGNF